MITASPKVSDLVEVVRGIDPTLEGPLLQEVEGTLRRLLFGEREYWLCWHEGIVTGRELRDVLLAHLQTTIENHTGHGPSDEALQRIVPDLEMALFGRRLAGEQPAED